MTSIVISMDDNLFSVVKHFFWVKWSSLARDDVLKKDIFDRFIKNKMSTRDEEFCERISWDPLDEMEVREEFIEELKKARNEPSGKSMTLDEFNEWCNSL